MQMNSKRFWLMIKFLVAVFLFLLTLLILSFFCEESPKPRLINRTSPVIVQPLPEKQEQVVAEPVLNLDVPCPSKRSEEAEYIAKALYGEARGCTRAEQEQVVWCILNRVDQNSEAFGKGIIGVVTKPHQFDGYSPNHPVWDSLYEVAIDVMTRWEAEKRGEAVERNLGKDYLWFHGDGQHNYFRNQY